MHTGLVTGRRGGSHREERVIDRKIDSSDTSSAASTTEDTEAHTAKFHGIEDADTAGHDRRLPSDEDQDAEGPAVQPGKPLRIRP